jgi:uncharacterized membrane protein HdeD (DUF308 family)
VVGLLYVVAAWAIVTGALKLAGAVHLGRHGAGAGWLALAGAVSLLFGLLLLVAPGPGLLGLIWWIGAYGVVRGVTLLAVALRLRHHHHGPHRRPPGGSGEPIPVGS